MGLGLAGDHGQSEAGRQIVHTTGSTADNVDSAAEIIGIKIITSHWAVTHLFAGFPCQDISGQGKQQVNNNIPSSFGAQ